MIDASISGNGLLVEFIDASSGNLAKQSYPWIWVRDHCIDPLSLDQSTTQRVVDTFSLSSDLICTNLSLDTSSQTLHLDWSDGANSSISAYVLASVIHLTPERHELTPDSPRILWNNESPLEDLPAVNFKDVMASDSGLLSWLKHVHVFGFCLVNDVPASLEGTRELALRLGMIQETVFGGFWPLSSELTEYEDSAYSDSYLEPHTDGTYYHDAAGLQMFNCLDIDCKGGESIQVDGFAIAEKIRHQDPAAFQTLCEIVVPGHYIDNGVHLRAQRPVIRVDSQGNLLQVSFNNYDRAPMLLDSDTQARFYHAYGLFHSHVVDQQNWLKIKMTPGTTLIFDNWRNMHGRMSFSGSRYFYGCYHSRAVFESKIRVLQSLV